jgi:hypothetical protein
MSPISEIQPKDHHSALCPHKKSAISLPSTKTHYKKRKEKKREQPFYIT